MAISYTKTNWVNGQAPAINATNLNNIENGVYNATTEVNNKYAKPSTGIPSSDMASAVQTSLGLANSAVQSDLLWTVSSETSQFPATPVTVSLSSYAEIRIEFRMGTTSSNKFSQIVPVGGNAILSISDKFNGTAALYTRTVTTSSSSVTFGDGKTTGNSTDNSLVIPCKIYGIKGVS